MLSTLEVALEPLKTKTFSGDVVAVLAPSHGHVPLYRAQLPGQLVRGSRTELPSLPRPERSYWPHCDDVVRLSEVPLQLPGALPRPPRSASPEPRSGSPRRQVMEDDELEVPYFDAEAALAAVRRERRQRSVSTERGRPLGTRELPSKEATDPNLLQIKSKSQTTEAATEVANEGTTAQSHGQQGQAQQAVASQEVRPRNISSRESSLEREKAAQAAWSRSLAQAEAVMMASIRPRPRPPCLQMVGAPPVVEVAATQAAERRIPDRRALDDRPDAESRSRGSVARQSVLSPARPKKSPRDLRAREKIGKLLVAHYEVRSKSLQTNKWNRMLMRVILACEEKDPEALKEGLALLQNAQNLIGAGDEGGSQSRVLLQALCLVDRKVKVRSSIADAVRTLEELTKRQEKLLVDMTPMGAEEASVGLHLEETDVTLATELKKSWQEVHREATAWPAMERAKESPMAKHEQRLKKKTEAEKLAAIEQMKKSMGTAVWRFAQAEAKKVEDEEDLGEEALQRAARIEYAIKAAEAQAVDSKHPDLLRALQITYDLRALRAMRYCQHLMSSIEQGVVGSAGKVANEIDQVITDASELYNVPKDHRFMEEARRLVLKARAEEAQVKRRDKR